MRDEEVFRGSWRIGKYDPFVGRSGKVAGNRLADEVEFAINKEPRCACVLLLDVSGSMSGERVAALNAGLHL